MIFMEKIVADGNAYRDLDLSDPKRQEEAARVWGEGRESLEKLLLYCMQNQVKTIACCSGHEHEPEHKNGYIAFDMTDKRTQEVIMKLLYLQANNKQKIETTFSRQNDRIGTESEHQDLISIFTAESKLVDETFFRLKEELQEILKGKSVEENPKVEKLKKIAEVDVKRKFYNTGGDDKR